MTPPLARNHAPPAARALTPARLATYLSGILLLELLLTMPSILSLRGATLLAVLVFACSSAMGADSGSKLDPGKIRKCQDATGKWHYGDEAAEECSRSKVEVISNRGTKTREIAAPPTEAELADRERRQDEIEREKHSAEEQARRDKILMQTYAVEDDITLVRDHKLSQLDATVKGSEETLKSLRGSLARMETQRQSEEEKNDTRALKITDKNIAATKAQIDKHEASVAAKRQEQEHLRKQYAEEIERYRELKRRQAGKAAAKSDNRR